MFAIDCCKFFLRLNFRWFRHFNTYFELRIQLTLIYLHYNSYFHNISTLLYLCTRWFRSHCHCRNHHWTISWLTNSAVTFAVFIGSWKTSGKIHHHSVPRYSLECTCFFRMMPSTGKKSRNSILNLVLGSPGIAGVELDSSPEFYNRFLEPLDSYSSLHSRWD